LGKFLEKFPALCGAPHKSFLLLAISFRHRDNLIICNKITPTMFRSSLIAAASVAGRQGRALPSACMYARLAARPLSSSVATFANPTPSPNQQSKWVDKEITHTASFSMAGD
tara:strand:- start:279 stop:614 length:336 start_codon:yes stop_codon:yes gene_type:complete